jgi:hypothetical protein
MATKTVSRYNDSVHRQKNNQTSRDPILQKPTPKLAAPYASPTLPSQRSTALNIASHLAYPYYSDSSPFD